jgi:tetratricopeptide (TPR) repeat protein
VKCQTAADSFLQQSAEELFETGLALYGEGRLAEAIEKFRQAMEIDPKDTFIHHMLGEALMASNNYLEAEEVLHNALELDCDNPMLLRGRGDALAALGWYRGALADYDKALAAYVARAEHIRSEAEKSRRSGAFDRADEWMGKAADFAVETSGLERRRREMLQRLKFR